MASLAPSPAGLAELLLARGGQVDRDMFRRARAVQSAAQRRAPVRTGALAGSITSEAEGPVGYRVGSRLPYAAAQEVGAKPHTITPRQAQVLRFTIGSQVVFARYVNHPGNEGRHYLRDSLAAAAVV